MPEVTTWQPRPASTVSIATGSFPAGTTWQDSQISDIDSLLIDINQDFIVDSDGNFISLGGGFDPSVGPVSAAWAQGNGPTSQTVEVGAGSSSGTWQSSQGFDTGAIGPAVGVVTGVWTPNDL